MLPIDKNNEKLCFVSKFYFHPNSDKEKPPNFAHTHFAGDDAFFMTPTTIGIADGVGGWHNTEGANPCQFSWVLMENCQHFLEKQAKSSPALPPLEVLSKAYEKLVQDQMVKAGSSTACLVSLAGRKCRFANLGDSSFIVLRPQMPNPYISDEEKQRCGCFFFEIQIQ